MIARILKWFRPRPDREALKARYANAYKRGDTRAMHSALSALIDATHDQMRRELGR